jgi:O-antigen ligase
LSTLVFAFWLVATVILTPYTFVIQLPGLPDLSIERMLFVVLAVMALSRTLRRDVVNGQDKLPEALIAIFCGICLLSMARFGFMEIYSAFARPLFVFMSGYAIPFLAFLYAKYLLDTEDDILAVFRVFFWFGCYLSLLSYLEHYGLKSLVYPSYITDQGISLLHLDRSRGPFLNAAFNGLALNFAFICGMFVLPTVRGTKRTAYIVLLVLFVPAIYFTRTRSVYLHFIMTLLALLFLYQGRISRWKLIPTVFVGVAMLVGLNMQQLASSDRSAGGMGETSEIEIRLALVEKSREMIAENPFGGIGLAQFRATTLFTPEDVDYQHNQLIGMATELGLPGVCVYLAILAVFFGRLYRLAGNIPEGKFLNANFVLLLAVGLLITMVNNCFVEPSLHLFANLNFFVLAGIADQLYNRFKGGRLRLPVRS